MATCEWCDDSTKALLEIWSDEQVQKKLKKGEKKTALWRNISQKLSAMGYGEKTADQCKVKIKNLIAKYRKVKDANRKSGNGTDNTFPFFDLMDGILGTRAASDPPIIVDSGAGPHTPEEDEDGKCNVMKHNLMGQQYVFYFVGPALDPTTDGISDTQHQTSTPQSNTPRVLELDDDVLNTEDISTIG